MAARQTKPDDETAVESADPFGRKLRNDKPNPNSTFASRKAGERVASVSSGDNSTFASRVAAREASEKRISSAQNKAVKPDESEAK